MQPQSAEVEYRVEVSGWDASETFFVERVTLQLGESGNRFILLRHPVRSGLMLFLRLVDSRLSFTSFPIAYQVKEVAPSGANGLSRVTLRRLPHRHGRDDGSTGTEELTGLP